MTIDQYFDRIFVINLDHRKDKWQLVTKNLNNMHITNYERFSAIKPDYNDISPEYKAWFSSKNHSDGSDETYSIGAMGCKMSHLSVINIAKNRGYDKVLILEDDVEFRQDAQKLFDMAVAQLEGLPPWDMLYFTGNHGRRYDKVSNNIIRIHGSHSTVGYAVHSHIFKTIVENGPKYYKHIDVFYKDKIHPFYNCYCIQPHILWNMDGYSDIEQGFREYNVLKRRYI